MDGLNSRMERTDERINELKYRIVEFTQYEQQRD